MERRSEKYKIRCTSINTNKKKKLTNRTENKTISRHENRNSLQIHNDNFYKTKQNELKTNKHDNGITKNLLRTIIKSKSKQQFCIVVSVRYLYFDSLYFKSMLLTCI